MTDAAKSYWLSDAADYDAALKDVIVKALDGAGVGHRLSTKPRSP